MTNKPLYTYGLANRRWVVYRMSYGSNGTSVGTKVSDHTDNLSARAEVYRLNGWGTPPDKQQTKK